MSRRLRVADDDGFTLIELLVVIIIIGILAAIAIPIYLAQIKRANEASERSDLRTVAEQMESFYVDARFYPTGDQVPDVTQSASIAGSDGAAYQWDGVEVSKHDTVTIKTGGGLTFCLDVSTTRRTANDWHWDSGAGGLLQGTCPA